MTCKLTMTLISEHQEGNCGNDWKYDLDAKVFHEGLKGEGRVSVPKHTLDAGRRQGTLRLTRTPGDLFRRMPDRIAGPDATDGDRSRPVRQ